MKHTNKKIFIVDDDKFLLDMYAVKFRESGFEVEVSQSTEEALRRLADGFVPDVLLLDVVMPGMNGLELLGKIREGNYAPDACIVILSNQGQPADIEQAKKLHVDGYIVKASTIPSEVLEQVEKMMEHKR